MKNAAVFLNLFNILVLLVSLVCILPTVMIFDAPGSQKKIGLWIVFWVFMVFPLVTLTCIGLGWKKWFDGDYEFALKVGAVAPVYGVVAAIFLFTFLR
ncbi:hypothetical protein EON83_09320 [bacterium]|nr:MAG: hypothetical protein EON83_09320 [bacterium]